MNVLWGEENLKHDKDPLVTIGTFDGVHRGHQAVFEGLLKWSQEVGLPAGVITFGQHPKKVLTGAGPELLTSLEHRLVLFERAGLDFCCVLEFTVELSQLTSAEFARRYLVEGLHISGLALGFDSRFGCDRMGPDSPELQPLGKELGFEVRCLEPIQTGQGTPVSSTLIREAIWAGRLKNAEDMLGRSVSVLGKVVHGEARGRRLGFRTANLDLDREVRPPFGVYVTRAILDGRTFGAVTNVGYRPTITGELPVGEKPDLLIETHLLDFKEDIYGKTLEVIFLKKLRDERRFGSVEVLVEQIKKDEGQAREVLSALGEG